MAPLETPDLTKKRWFRCNNDYYFQYLFTSTSFEIVCENSYYRASYFNFNESTRHLTATAGPYEYEIFFSPDYLYIIRGTCITIGQRNRFWLYGSGQRELYYRAVPPLANDEGISSFPSFNNAITHRQSVAYYCGRNVGQSGYAESSCRSCDGRCGPDNGCQCKACARISIPSVILSLPNIDLTKKRWFRCHMEGYFQYLFTSTSFEIICENSYYRASYFHFDESTRHLTATAGPYAYEIFFSPDYLYIIRGTCTTTGRVWVYGSGSQDLYYRAVPPLANDEGISSFPSFNNALTHGQSVTYYCGRNVGQSGYSRSSCRDCDGYCGPDNGCQCKACARISIPVFTDSVTNAANSHIAVDVAAVRVALFGARDNSSE